ncbi:MAG: patatin-like phospholipase family protein [Bacteroidota bacterium]|nr:patatin-like phospholipase family protein [Bacteroidota bacterium]
MSSQNSVSTALKAITTEDFTNHPEVIDCIKKLDTEFSSGNRQFIISDVLDEEGNQYVNLVQKGGGVLGIALIGYTYILEKMGIRFIRLAGTSAGAINTALMTVIGEKHDAKSIEILKSICALNFFDLVDGHPAAKFIIRKFITHEDFTIKVKKWLSVIMLAGILLMVLDFIFLGLQHKHFLYSAITKVSFAFTGFYFLLISVIIYYFSRLLKRLKDSGFGINPGNFFYDWIKQQLISNGVNTVSDLNKKASTLPVLHLRENNPESIDTLVGDVTFITSELVTKNKIQFPQMCNLFREKKDIDTLQPAGFVRASMSIPLFFESYFINNIPCSSDEIKKAWMDTMNEPDPPSTARFVDGGILSNFPINIFYNPQVLIPRLPSFGIDLDDCKPEDESKNAAGWTFIGYLSRMFDTIRSYYDKDFLIKNKVFDNGIGKIPLVGYNWLNFFLKDEDKIKMFILGAKAATDFLIKFDWEDYKNERAVMQVKLNKERPPADVANPIKTTTA